MPGDPVSLLTERASPVFVTPDTKVALTHYYGLDQPALVQFWRYLACLFHGMPATRG